ncbi:MAG: GGDEF domain-containing protein [Leptolyngbya sp. RL_3_1]|nr:GGDEF domain-containing protein [Leptolyngbya sp. RL_3_1]
MQLINVCALICVAVIWSVEAQAGPLNPFDQWTYPPAVAALMMSIGLLMGNTSPRRLGLAKVLTIGMATSYVLGQAQVSIQYPQVFSTYSQYSICLWLPLLYVLNFLFLKSRHALMAAAAIYGSLLVSALVRWGREGSSWELSNQMGLLLTILLSHPVYIIALVGITNLHQALMQAQQQSADVTRAANTDHLTQLANRRAISDRLQQHLQTSCPCGVILLDLDHFKAINDTYGHDQGDQVLIMTAQLLTTALSEEAWVGRWGGEEFIVVVETDQLATAMQWAETCRHRLAQHPFPTVTQVTASFGVAMALQDRSSTIAVPGDTLETLVKRADQALYLAKRQRNTVRCAPNAIQVGECR